MISENLKCEISEQISETSLNFYFRKKLFELTGVGYAFDHNRRLGWTNETSILYYRCHRANRSSCKSRFLIIFDMRNKMANIYQNEQNHSHKINKRFNHSNLKKSRMDVI